jgi:outer membrane protein OmpA-like peptidoglycan-associated protein
VKDVLSKDRHLIVVTGYASSKGSEKENKVLIEQRAVVVAKYVHQTLRVGGSLSVSVKVRGGGIRHVPAQLQDQVAILSA